MKSRFDSKNNKSFSLKVASLRQRKYFIFFLQPKHAQRRVIQGVQNQFWKTRLWSSKRIKTNVCHVYLGEKINKSFLQKMHSCSKGGECFSRLNKNQDKAKLLRLFGIWFETQVSEVQKKWKTKVLNLKLNQKMIIVFLMSARATRGIF